MMINKLFTYHIVSQNENSIQAKIEIDYTNNIFEGHFPAMPVLPGVCQLHAVKTTMEQALGVLLQLDSANALKFTNMVSPDTTKILACSIVFEKNDNGFKAQASLSHEQTMFFKLKGYFKIV